MKHVHPTISQEMIAAKGLLPRTSSASLNRRSVVELIVVPKLRPSNDHQFGLVQSGIEDRRDYQVDSLWL